MTSLVEHATTDETGLLGEAWGVIANVSHSNWREQTAEWREAAERWRDRFHQHLAEQCQTERTSNDEKIAQIRDWLRYHGEYDVEINLHSVYATIQIGLYRLGTEVWSDIGMTLAKRLDNVLAAIAKLGAP